MNLTDKQQESQELLQKIITKAWEDEAFKQELISSPINAIKKLTGEHIKLPEGKTLIVRDQTDDATIYINIPTEFNMEDTELSEEQLEAIAGGTHIPFLNLPDFSKWRPGEDGGGGSQ